MNVTSGELWSPFYIIVKDYGRLDFSELFQLLKIERYSHRIRENKIKIGKNSSDVLFVIRRGDWIQIMDNWGYKLWHDKKIRKDIEQLSKSYEIFHFSMGDIDYDYDFSYYKNGELIRKFSIEKRSSKNMVVIEDFGTPFQNEPKTNKFEEPFEIVIPIAKSLGITFEHNLKDIEVYSKNVKDLEKSESKKRTQHTAMCKTAIASIRRLLRLH